MGHSLSEMCGSHVSEARHGAPAVVANENAVMGVEGGSRLGHPVSGLCACVYFNVRFCPCRS